MKKHLLVLAAAATLVASVIADTIIRPPTVEWQPVTKYSDGRNIETNAVVKYNVYRSSSLATNWVKVTTTTNLTYSDTNITVGVTYRYRIAGELWGLEGTNSAITDFIAYGPAKPAAAPAMQQ